MSSVNPISFKYLAGAKNVTVTTPGFLPISMEPVMVARFITSGTSIFNTLAARLRPFSVAHLM